MIQFLGGLVLGCMLGICIMGLLAINKPRKDWAEEHDPY